MFIQGCTPIFNSCCDTPSACGGENHLYKYLMYILSDDHLYFVSIDYLLNCNEVYTGALFVEGLRDKVLEAIVYQKKETFGRIF